MSDANKLIKKGVHGYSDYADYIPPKSEVVQEHLAWFKGLKLGFMMHWAPVTQLGLKESWPLCDKEASWSREGVDWTEDMDEFKEQYWNLNKTFNPIKFRPDRWAALAKECGFKYVLLTTKHHDGFCMYDSHETDYKITDPSCPFSSNKRANVVKEVFDAFRAEGLGVSAYFSKPDWHHDCYWRKEFGNPPDRNVNYDVTKYPELWEEFVQFVHRQLTELTTEYGKIDVLWLDGGWVRPDGFGQNIRLGEVVDKIRATTQPQMICCDRTVSGPYEDIITPEQGIPAEPIPVPWEACITLGRRFSFCYEDDYKSARQVVHILVDIVSKGGSLALNITPQPDGALPMKAVAVLKDFGRWMNQNGDGIYFTEIAPYPSEGQIAYTQKGNTTNLFWLYAEQAELPAEIVTAVQKKVSGVTLRRTGAAVGYHYNAEGFLVLETGAVSMDTAEYADCFAIEEGK